MSTPILEIAGVSKTFAGQRALAAVSLEVHPGEVLAIVGQNGSGKSTLIRTLAGFHDPDPGGTIIARGELHFIHQDLALVEALSTVENLGLGPGLGRKALLPTRRRHDAGRAEALLARFGASHDVHMPIGQLSRAQQTIVAIARALDGWTSDENVIVLDEPTAALHHEEAETLFTAIRELTARGTGVIFVSHRLDEVVELADRVMVLRDGRVVAQVRRGQYGQADLVRMMAGTDVEAPTRKARNDPRAELVLQARSVEADRLRGADLEARGGEIVGITGLVGSGSEHVCSLIFGALSRSGGVVTVAGRPLPPNDPAASIKAGVGFVPADRPALGALLSMTVEENLTLADLDSLTSRGGRLGAGVARRETAGWIARVDVRPPDPARPMALLSGGNQQKVVMAKWLRTQPRLLLLDEPTQGVDVAAKAALHALILDAAETGTAVLISSTDTRELVDLCDRVLVFRDGRVAAEIAREDLTEERLTCEAFDITDAGDRHPAAPITGGISG